MPKERLSQPHDNETQPARQDRPQESEMGFDASDLLNQEPGVVVKAAWSLLHQPGTVQMGQASEGQGSTHRLQAPLPILPPCQRLCPESCPLYSGFC